MKSDILFSPASPESDSLSADDTQPMQTPRFDHIGQFLVEEKIGEGGMGVVYRAHDPSLQRTVAIKRVHPRLKDHHDIRDKFLAEARAIAAVNHPNIGQIHAIHDEDDLPYLVMEFLPGPSFEEELNERGKLPIEEVLKVAISATRALEEARNQGIIHRDIKPSNLIVDALGNIKLVDFGLAGSIEEDATEGNEVVGTPQYCSPEQVQGHGTDERSDIYSLGATLYHLLTGEPPYTRDSRMDLLIAHVNAPVPDIVEALPTVDPEFAELIQAMLNKAPDQRPQNHSEVLARLQAITQRIDPEQAPPRSTRLLASAVVVLILAVIGGSVLPGSLLTPYRQQLAKVDASFGDLLTEKGSVDQLTFEFNNVETERFFRPASASGNSGARNQIRPNIREGQLRWANDPEVVRFPYMSRLDRWEVSGLRMLGSPDLELQVAADPDQPGNRWRIGLAVGKSTDPTIEVLQHGSPVPIEIEQLLRKGFLREGIDHQLILKRLESDDPDRDRFRLQVQPQNSADPLLQMTFQIPATAIPSGAPGLRLEGDFTGWNTKVDRVVIEGDLNRKRILRDWRLAGTP